MVIACDARAIAVPSPPALEALARLQLSARRLGATIELHNVSPALADLIAVAGLADVLVVAGPSDDSGVEVEREAEEGEQPGIDEEVLGGDDTT